MRKPSVEFGSAFSD